MVSDVERFIELYKSFGIECVVNKESDFNFIHLCVSDFPFDEKSTLSDKIIGYSDFFSTVRFDKEGNFINQGFYE